MVSVILTNEENNQFPNNTKPHPLSYHPDRPVTRAVHMIRKIISKSKVPEDPLHAENTVALLLKLKPDTPLWLRIAALGHDIERALPDSIKTQRLNFSSYDDFKRAHAENSARILKGLLIKCGVDSHLVERVHELVRLHEFGGTRDADLLKDADSLSFFCVNLPLFMLREQEETVKKRVAWGISRLGPDALRMLKQWCDQGHPDSGAKNYTRWPAHLILEQMDEMT